MVVVVVDFASVVVLVIDNVVLVGAVFVVIAVAAVSGFAGGFGDVIVINVLGVGVVEVIFSVDVDAVGSIAVVVGIEVRIGCIVDVTVVLCCVVGAVRVVMDVVGFVFVIVDDVVLFR